MDDNKKIEKIEEKFLELPEDVQKALFSVEVSETISGVGKKYGLVVNKLGELADETGLIMLGLTKPSEYIKNLEQRLGVSASQAKEIAEDINQKVFSPIRESLKKIHGITASAQAEAPKKIPEHPTPTKISSPAPQKIIMPAQPEHIKTGETAKAVEPKIDLKPSLSGRIETAAPPPVSKIYEPQKQEEPSIPPSIREIEKAKKELPDIFLKKIPIEKFEENTAHQQKEAKNKLEKELAPTQKPSDYNNQDPYKEPRE